MRWKLQHVEGRHNLGSGPERESYRPIVVRKRGNARGAKGPDRGHVSVDKEGEPLGQESRYGRTGEARELSRLRQELGRKAKQKLWAV
ncbi:MAG: hypothetical protein L6435_12930 [Anaerolineae bacterium]|nr:hypothetical protein [Anaerolineae bacterium]